jgi:hypothetical protein
MSIKGTFKPIILVNNSINILISKGIFVPLVNIIILLIIINNIYKYMFI